ncbi:VAMP-associated protein involved in inositol metabolism [Handroanthus impetiginosus]|uniref:VAMP-associated protein involved in inositol metabolism n=1 Tax=Handroanthus impetiginosus TaxID=429701 RepID=A0A2G9GJB7_9LAMI|nr:VAMP-associated protein involved in inositol metabolism [Handroanthus impetiginosus]
MSAEQLLSFEPSELSFPFELNKQLASSIRLLNNTDNHVAFKLLTTNPKKYGVRPKIGILLPGAACDITVTTRVAMGVRYNMRCKDKFMIQSGVANADTTTEDVQKMFNKEAGDVFQESKLRVVYTKPPESSFELSAVESPNSNPPAVESPRSNPFAVESPQSNLPAVEIPKSNVPEVTNPVIHPPENVLQMSPRKLLDVQPPELQFPLSPDEELSRSIQLSNVTESHVAFRVKTTTPKYFVQPNIGILLPRSTRDITVRTQDQIKVPSAMQSGDKVLIQSVVATTAATTEDLIHDMLDEASSPIEERELQVVCISKLENKGDCVDELILKGIIISLLGLVSCYLMKQTLSLIWSLTMLAIMLMMKMIKKLVSESLEDWVVKTLLSIILHFVQFLFRRKNNIGLSSD